MANITEETTLAELALELAQIGSPVLTVRYAVVMGTSRYGVTLFSQPHGQHFFGSADTLCRALNSAVGSLREEIMRRFEAPR